MFEFTVETVGAWSDAVKRNIFFRHKILILTFERTNGNVYLVPHTEKEKNEQVYRREGKNNDKNRKRNPWKLLGWGKSWIMQIHVHGKLAKGGVLARRIVSSKGKGNMGRSRDLMRLDLCSANTTLLKVRTATAEIVTRKK